MILTRQINFSTKLHETHVFVLYDSRDVTKIMLKNSTNSMQVLVFKQTSKKNSNQEYAEFEI